MTKQWSFVGMALNPGATLKHSRGVIEPDGVYTKADECFS